MSLLNENNPGLLRIIHLIQKAEHIEVDPSFSCDYKKHLLSKDSKFMFFKFKIFDDNGLVVLNGYPCCGFSRPIRFEIEHNMRDGGDLEYRMAFELEDTEYIFRNLDHVCRNMITPHYFEWIFTNFLLFEKHLLKNKKEAIKT